MSEIVLINPPSKRTPHTKFTVHHGVAPIGMAYIAGSLKEKGFQHQVIDAVGEGLFQYEPFSTDRSIYLRGLNFDQVISKMGADTKYVLISSMYLSDWVVCRKLIYKIKESFPYSTIILGGENPTTFWNKILEFDQVVDYCIIGEGDDIIINLLNCLQNNEDPKKVQGVALRTPSGRVFMTERPARIKNLIDYRPDWSQFPLENYFKARTTTRAIGRRSMPIIASRGCVYRCSFCTSETKWGTTFITRPVEDVVDEFRLYRDLYNIEHICVVDLAASINKNWFMDLVRALVKADLGITWELSSGTRSEFLTRENLILMKQSQFTYLTLAPDTGSEKTVMDIEKRINIGKFNRALNDVIDLNMWVKTNFIVGMFQQTKKEVLDTYKMALKYSLKGVDDVVLYPYVPFPGSKMFDNMLRDGVVKLNTQKEYQNFILEASTYSIVALNNENIKYPLPVTYTHQMVMVICFFISLIRKPQRIFIFIKRLLTRSPMGVFEVAVYQSLAWYFLMVKLKLRGKAKKTIYEDPCGKETNIFKTNQLEANEA
ncbi:MAG: hypothetical protein CME60_03940 [Halobacteriovoraceae bacterium]|nr:hypothetical protein [Halobacteriovoraceae bacterium]